MSFKMESALESALVCADFFLETYPEIARSRFITPEPLRSFPEPIIRAGYWIFLIRNDNFSRQTNVKAARSMVERYLDIACESGGYFRVSGETF